MPHKHTHMHTAHTHTHTHTQRVNCTVVKNIQVWPACLASWKWTTETVADVQKSSQECSVQTHPEIGTEHRGFSNVVFLQASCSRWRVLCFLAGDGPSILLAARAKAWRLKLVLFSREGRVKAPPLFGQDWQFLSMCLTFLTLQMQTLRYPSSAPDRCALIHFPALISTLQWVIHL